MRDLIRSMVNLSVAMPLLAMRQAVGLFKGQGLAGSVSADLDSVTEAVEGQMEGTAKDVYERGVRLERQLLGKTEREATPSPRAVAGDEMPAAGVDSGDLDARTLVVLGEGLAAGFGDFSLAEEFQRESFASQLAAQIGSELSLPRFESPGIGDAPGFERLPVMVPALMQGTTLTDFPPAQAPRNLSIPGFRVCDAARLRPSPPLVHQQDARQTMANMVLGLPELLDAPTGNPLPSQLERAVSHKPSLAIVELGFYEVLEATVAGRPADLPDSATFRRDYEEVVAKLRDTGASLLLMTVPDPLDTAYFSSLDSAAANLRVEPSLLVKDYGLSPDDLVSLPALMEMGFQVVSGTMGPLPPAGILKRAVAAQVSDLVKELNGAIGMLAAQHHAEVFDLAALLRKVAQDGVQVGKRKLTADFLGGFYLLNGYYPGATGHAVIANALIDRLNERYGSSFRHVDLEQARLRDPAAEHRPAGGPVLTGKSLRPPGAGVTEVASRRTDTTGGEARRVAKAISRGTSKSRPAAGSRLELPKGLEQTLPLSHAASYFGDAIRPVHCRHENEQMFGSGRELLFGGLALLDSHLKGEIRIRFSEPVKDLTHFEVRHGNLEGDDGALTAPQFFKLPARRCAVRDDDKLVSSGDLNLATGKVSNLKYAGRLFNTALMALVRVNPKLPDVPIEFPGLYGSAWATFEQRDDGLLDFSFFGTTFLPLGGAIEGDPVRFPLPFCGPTLEFASVGAPGTTLHPHLHLSTKEPAPADHPALVPEIPINTVREYTFNTRHTSFGDKFTLYSPELSGDPTGRSQLLGRLMVQFGSPSGDSVPVAISCLNPGGMLAEPAASPLADEFPGRLPAAPVGHNEFLRFATRTYFLDGVTCIDDPFDLSVGNVSRSTGRLLADHLHRALIGQNMFYALLRVEPRTPKSSFHFRGPAHFEKGTDGRTLFRFAGLVNIPYPEGFLFPAPDLATGVVIGPHSELDPFYWIQAVQHDRSSDALLSGSASKLLSSTNELFSYRYEISGDPAGKPPVFEYTNHTVDGVFRLKSLAWVSFLNSREGNRPAGGYDTVSFAGFGTWSRDPKPGLHLVCAQISEAAGLPYVSIQIGSGFVSNVNTKPAKLEDVRP